MNINVFLLCYNESALLPHTIKHYQTYLPSCHITIYDNESTDDSVAIATNAGCSIVSWQSNQQIDDFKYRDIKNHAWKSVSDGWIIMADMDEFLCVREDELWKEFQAGTTILQVKGYEMMGESQYADLHDIDLQTIQKYVDKPEESKKLCFLRDKITDMHYGIGAHSCNPEGVIQYSSNIYINKHMNMLGIPFYIQKMKSRYARATEMRKRRIACHYHDDVERATAYYLQLLARSKTL
jgi:hypothetical protein